jgi:hypothetical protein
MPRDAAYELTDAETFHKEPNLLEQIAYRDAWGAAPPRSSP